MRPDVGTNEKRKVPSVLFLGLEIAGHKTRFLNLKTHTRDNPRIRPTYHRVTPWIAGGVIERLPLLPDPAKGRLRTVREYAPLAILPRPDVIWTVAGGCPGAPFLYQWSLHGPLRRPLVADLDWTLEQQESMAPIYFGRSPKRRLSLAVAHLIERTFYRSVTLFTPWSNWVANSLRRQGIPDERIRVLPPGVDLDQWRPRLERRCERAGPLRLLFVGADFERKGGLILLDVLRSRFAERCTLDVVTRDPVLPQPGVQIHRAEANSPLLRELYAKADLFVLPTRAECFGIAAVEAQASGLPVIASDIGGISDIVEDGKSGWLIQPTGAALAEALEDALRRRSALPAMSRQARHHAEERFDGRRNDEILVDLLVAQAERFNSLRHAGHARPPTVQ